MDLTLPLFALAELALVGGPIAVLITAMRFRRPGGSARREALRAAAVVAVAAAGWTTGVEFSLRPANWLVLAAAYIAWSVLVGLLFALRPRWLGTTAGGLATLTLAPGLILATVGMLGLMFVSGDYGRAPLKTIALGPGLECVETGWGMAASDDGHTSICTATSLGCRSSVGKSV